VAYFDARLALLNKKNATYHQLAQVKAYTELERVLTRMLHRLKGGADRAGTSSGIEVEETGDDMEQYSQKITPEPVNAGDPVDKVPANNR